MAEAAALPSGHVPSFFGRVAGIVFAPWREWADVAQESTTARDLYLGYVAPLAAIGVVATFVANVLIGLDVGAMRVRAGIPAGVAAGLVHYALAFVAVALLARITAALAPRFGGTADRNLALRIVVYSLIPAWLVAALAVAPALHALALVLALYGVFVLFLGLRTAMRCPEGWAIFLAAILSGLALVFAALASPIASFATGLAALGSPRAGARATARTSRVPPLPWWRRCSRKATRTIADAYSRRSEPLPAWGPISCATSSAARPVEATTCSTVSPSRRPLSPPAARSSSS
jgi:hypothetical protein